MTTSLKLSSDADLVGAVPHLLGFHPEESITLLTTPMVPGGRGVGPAARLDLADAGGPAGDEYVAHVVRRFHRDRLGIYAVVVHTDVPLRTARELNQVLDAVRRVREHDDPRVGAWLVAGDGWLRLPGHSPFEERAGDRDLAELGHSRAVTELVLTGSAPLRDRTGLGIERSPGSEVGRLFADAVSARMQRRAPSTGMTVRAYDDMVRAGFLGTGRPRARDRELLARLLVGLERLEVRDAVLTRVIVGRSLPVELLADPQMVGPLWAGGPTEDPERRVPLEVLARYAPDGAAAPALSMLAMLAWRRGEGARAAVLSEQALTDRPGYSLAELVADLQSSGTAPAGLGGPGAPAPGPLGGPPPWTDQGEEDWMDLGTFEDDPDLDDVDLAAVLDLLDGLDPRWEDHDEDSAA